MPDLIAQGERAQERWRRTLPADRVLVLGRAAGVWSTPWDDKISRQHIHMVWRAGRLEVTRMPNARNPVFFRGRDTQHIHVKPGDHFVIGSTTFTVADERAQPSVDERLLRSEQSFSSQYLRQIRFRDADRRIDVLSRLPEIIKDAANDSELFVRVVNVILTGIPQASAVAIVRVPSTKQSPIEVLHWDRRLLTGDDFRPSERLIRESVRRAESVVNIWSDGPVRESHFTQRDNVDWAFCSPVQGNDCDGWAIYVEGASDSTIASSPHASDPHEIRDDLKFTELAAMTLSSLREVRALERSQTSLSQFFSPLVLDALTGQDPEVVLAPREADVSVLFCDLRGFSRKSEESAANLLELLQRVSDALGVMTRHILDQGGVVGDFHGDAAMGFWGWPLSQPDAVQRACRAALGIRADFEAAAERPHDPLRDFQIGLGIATGRAVAGKIGTVDQVKVTVFGPVVNLASRLEGMTKAIHAPILIDKATAHLVRQQMSRDEARTRRVAVVRPYGLSTPLEVSELLPAVDAFPQLSDDHIEAYENAVDALLKREWARAFNLLHQVPANDRVKDFLTVFIAQHNRTAPPDWDGVIPITSK